MQFDQITMDKQPVWWCLFVLLNSGLVTGKVCMKKYTIFLTTYTTYFSCSNLCCCGDEYSTYCCACDSYWWIGTVIGSVIGFIVFVTAIVIIICVLVKHNKRKNGRVIVPGQTGTVGYTASYSTTTSGGYTHHTHTVGPQPGGSYTTQSYTTAHPAAGAQPGGDYKTQPFPVPPPPAYSAPVQ